MSLQIQFELCIRLAIALALSALIGYERERHGEAAGLRTHMLVGLGAALFTGLSIFAFGPSSADRIAAQIVSGIGFLGAGAIIQRQDAHYPRGITTAAGIWAVAAIGMASGTGAYVLAAFGAVLIVFVQGVLLRISERINPVAHEDEAAQSGEPLGTPIDPEAVGDVRRKG